MDANNSGSMDVAEFIQFLEFEVTQQKRLVPTKKKLLPLSSTHIWNECSSLSRSQSKEKYMFSMWYAASLILFTPFFFLSQDTKFIRALVECCLFGTADLNGDGVLDFGEFVLAVALIATYSKDQVHCDPSLKTSIVWQGLWKDGRVIITKKCFISLASSGCASMRTSIQLWWTRKKV